MMLQIQIIAQKRKTWWHGLSFFLLSLLKLRVIRAGARESIWRWNKDGERKQTNKKAKTLTRSLDDQVLNGDGNEDGREGEQGDDKEGELLVCQAASLLLRFGYFRSGAAWWAGGLGARGQQCDAGAVRAHDLRGVLALTDRAHTETVLWGWAQGGEAEYGFWALVDLGCRRLDQM